MGIVPLFLSSSNLWTPVRSALTLALVCDVATGILIFRLTRSITASETAAGIAALLWFLFPVTALIGLRGMEASLSTLLVMTALRLTVRFASPGMTWKGSVLLGAVLALGGLARTDNLVCTGLATAVAVALAPRRNMTGRRVFGWLVLSAVTATLLVMPWFVWSYKLSGALVQVSGLVKLRAVWVFGSLPGWGGTFAQQFATLTHRVLASFVTPIRFLIGEEFHSTAMTPAITLAVLFLYATRRRSLAGRSSQRERAAPPSRSPFHGLSPTVHSLASSGRHTRRGTACRYSVSRRSSPPRDSRRCSMGADAGGRVRSCSPPRAVSPC